MKPKFPSSSANSPRPPLSPSKASTISQGRKVGRMKVTLYHGTSEAHARRIAHEGIRPRNAIEGDGESNWDIPSRPDMVYLTDVYAGYFAAAASEDGEKWGIAEVVVDSVNLFPDEDYLEQASRGDGPCPKGDMGERTRWYRDRLENFGHHALDSLEHLGNVAHCGPIPVKNVKRVVLFDPSKSGMIATMAVDPSISIVNHQYMSDKYRAMTQAIMRYRVKAEDLAGVFWQVYDEDQRARYRRALNELHLAIEVIKG
jgi:hypothetical protein